MPYLNASSMAAVYLMFGVGHFACADAPAVSAASAYTIVKAIALGAPDRWDYLSFDAASNRLFVAHETSIAVLDGKSGQLLGRVEVNGANGVAVVPALGKGYAGSRAKKTVRVFDLSTLEVIKEIPADDDTDGVVYDPASGRVFVMDGDPHNLTVIDTGTDTVVKALTLSGTPEYAAVDGRGHLFVNITDKRQIQRIDTGTATVTATWPIDDCQAPHGLAIDPVARRLFATCVNERMMVVDADDGHVVTRIPIGDGSDAAAFDPRRKRIFSSNGDGTLSVILMQSPEKFVALTPIPTRPLARTMALDSDSGRIYMVAAERVVVDPKATSVRKRFAVRPGSVQLLMLDPVDGGMDQENQRPRR